MAQSGDVLGGDRRGVLSEKPESERSSSHRLATVRPTAFLFGGTRCSLLLELPWRYAEISGATGSRCAVGGQIATSEIAISRSVSGARRGER